MKHKHNQNTESPKTTRQDSPGKKKQQKQKTKATKKNNQNLEFDKS